LPRLVIVTLYNLLHVKRHCRHLFGMVGASDRHTGNGHVGVADGFDFLDPMPLAEVIELGENRIQ
jgi:hypothetical protein